MNKPSAFFIGLLLAGFTVGSHANTDTNVSQSELDTITAECTQEAKGAVYPDVYADNCVDERLEAVKEQSGQSEKDKS